MFANKVIECFNKSNTLLKKYMEKIIKLEYPLKDQLLHVMIDNE